MLGRIPITYYALSGLFNLITIFTLALFVFFKNPRSRTNQTFSLWLFTVVGWSLFYFLWLNTKKNYLAEFYLRTLMVFVIFIPSTFTHFISTLTKVDSNKKIILGNYLISVFLGIMAYTKLFASDIGPFLIFPYWLKPRFLFGIHSIHFFVNIIYSYFLMLQIIKNQSGIFRNQVLYVFIGTVIGYSAGAINYLTWYRIPIPPFLNPLVSIFVAFAGYAIFKYRLMDINLVFRSGLIFLPYTVISIVTFVTINILLHKLLWINMGVIVLLILSAPFIYQYLQKHSRTVIDSTIYKDKFTYIEKLEKFIENMVLIPKEEDLLNKTVQTLAKELGITQIAVFTYDHVLGNYQLGSQIGLDGIKDLKISGNNGIAAWLKNTKEPFVKEEMEKILEKTELLPIKDTLDKLSATICIPVLFETDLLGIITLGEKVSGEMYSHLDTEILRRLGIQLAVALDYKRVESELQKKQEYAAIGQLAFEITHEMKNLLAPINTFMQLLPERLNDSEFINTMSRFSKTNVDAINRKVEDILYFGQEQKLNLSAGLDINKLLSNTAEGLRPLAQKDNIPIVEELGDIPKIIADEELLLHVFNNLIMNAIDAMKNRVGKIRIRTQRHNDPSIQMKQISPRWIRIEVKDDGEGIPDKVKEKIFDAFITTKSGGGMLQKRGMGLGLTIVKKIVDQHHGVVGVNSSVGKGTTFIVDLPVEQRG